MSGDAYVWAKAHPCPSARAKAVLKALAGYADADGRAWAPVSVLLIETDLGSDRTVQRGLSELRSAGIIEDTGETKVHLGKLIPIYRLALEKGPANTRERLLQERRMAEAAEAPTADLGVTLVSPQAGTGDTDDTARGDTGDALGVTPVSPKYIQGNLQLNSQGAREALARGFEGLLEAIPARMLRFFDRDRALAAYLALAERPDAGQVLADLPDAARFMGEHPDFRSRKHPPSLEAWLAGQWDGWRREMLEARAAPGEAEPAHAVRETIPPDVAAVLGPGVTNGATWVEATRVLVAHSNILAKRVRETRRADLQALDIRVMGPGEVQPQEVS